MEREDQNVSEILTLNSRLFTSESGMGIGIVGLGWFPINEANASSLEGPSNKLRAKMAIL